MGTGPKGAGSGWRNIMSVWQKFVDTGLPAEIWDSLSWLTWLEGNLTVCSV